MKGPVPEGIGPFAFSHANDPKVFKVVKDLKCAGRVSVCRWREC